MANVIVYSTPTCPYCKLAMQFLHERNIPYTEKDVSVDQGALETMVEQSGQMGVPVIDVDGKIMVGYSEKALREALHLNS